MYNTLLAIHVHCAAVRVKVYDLILKLKLQTVEIQNLLSNITRVLHKIRDMYNSTTNGELGHAAVLAQPNSISVRNSPLYIVKSSSM